MAKLWKQHELDLLEKMVERYPSFKCVKEYQKRAKKLGYPERNDLSIRNQVIVQFGGFRKIIRLSNFTIKDLQEIFNLPRYNFHNWIREGKLHAERIGNRLLMISATSMRKFACEYPYALSYVEKDRLLYFFKNDIDFVEKILATRKDRRGGKKPIKNTITGQTYSSVREAARFLHYSPAQISRQLRQPKSGWIYLNP